MRACAHAALNQRPCDYDASPLQSRLTLAVKTKHVGVLNAAAAAAAQYPRVLAREAVWVVGAVFRISNDLR